MKAERLAEIRKRQASAQQGYDATNTRTYAVDVWDLLTLVDEQAEAIIRLQAMEMECTRAIDKLQLEIEGKLLEQPVNPIILTAKTQGE